ncbi:MAG: hypothetical protein LBS59_06510 [Puniceicoccales bacterium]|jgi:outer membrane cobalamin receptor|nr:hypothetical protein [Puniceicoccales bacterium]
MAGVCTPTLYAALAETQETAIVALPTVSVTASRVANIEPADAFATLVTALRFDPLVDAQVRGAGGAQADICLRGGVFENTGFSIGGLAFYAAQTGHYAAELPVAPAMLGIPETRLGAAAARTGWNATAGNIAYEWLPIADGASTSAGLGGHNLFTAEAHAGAVSKEKFFARTIALDIAVAQSSSDGYFGAQQRIAADGTPYPDGASVPFSDHAFQRYNVRLQLRDATSQTDIFATHQRKNFAWPNLYAKARPSPLWREEREDVETSFHGFSHRQETNTTGDWVRAGVFFSEIKDRYTIPVITGYSAQHKTRVSGGALDGRQTFFANAAGRRTELHYRFGIVADNIESTALIYGRYSSRTHFYAGIYADQTLPISEKNAFTVTAGLFYDDFNRGSGTVSPLAGVAWHSAATDSWLRRVKLDYSETTQLPSYTVLNSAPNGLFGGNPDLGRSRSHNVELGVDLATPTAGGWRLSPTVFFRRDDALVDWVFAYASGERRSARAVDIDTLGVELVARRSWKHIDLTLGYAWMHRNDNYTSEVTGSFYAMNFASHRLTAATVIRLGFGLEARCDNEFRIQEKNALRGGTNKPFFTTISIVWRVPHFTGLSISAQVDNLWDVRYEEVPLVPGTPRSWSIRASYQW